LQGPFSSQINPSLLIVFLLIQIQWLIRFQSIVQTIMNLVHQMNINNKVGQLLEVLSLSFSFSFILILSQS
jgi:hypothetical protein